MFNKGCEHLDELTYRWKFLKPKFCIAESTSYTHLWVSILVERQQLINPNLDIFHFGLTIDIFTHYLGKSNLLLSCLSVSACSYCSSYVGIGYKVFLSFPCKNSTSTHKLVPSYAANNFWRLFLLVLLKFIFWKWEMTGHSKVR